MASPPTAEQHTPAALPGAPSPGLLDPIFDSQAVFRRLLNSLAAPGSVLEFPAVAEGVGAAPSEVLAILLALADADTPVWLPPAMHQEAITRHLAFHGGIPITGDPQAAAFAVVDGSAFAAQAAAFPIGTPEYPDRSTTLIVPCWSITADDDGGLSLVGPGIETRRQVGLDPLPAGLVDQMARNGVLYPLGLDMIFTAPGRVAAIPRSTRLES